MSERSQRDSIVSVREVRPTEDLSLLKSYELRRVFESETVSALGLISRGIALQPESFRPISAPLVIEAREPMPAVRETRDPPAKPPAEPSPADDVPREPKATAPAEAEVPRRDWLLDPEPNATAADPQPYGDDPVRMRELLQWFADGRSASSSVLVQRAAGDLVEVPAERSERSTRLRSVLASTRAS